MQSLVDNEHCSFVESVRLTVAVIGRKADRSFGISARIDGPAANLAKKGKPVEQAGALTVQQVMKLKRMVVNFDSLQHRCIRGATFVMMCSCFLVLVFRIVASMLVHLCVRSCTAVFVVLEFSGSHYIIFFQAYNHFLRQVPTLLKGVE